MVIIYEAHSLVNIQTVNITTPKKRKVLTLEERVQAVQLLNRERVHVLLQKKWVSDKIMSDYDANENLKTCAAQH